MSKKAKISFTHDFFWTVFKLGNEVTEENCHEILYKCLLRDDTLINRTYVRGEPVKARKTRRANCNRFPDCK